MISMDEQKFNEASSELKNNEAVEEVFLLDKEGNVKFKSGDFELSPEEAVGIIKTWTQKENALMFQGSRFAILKNDDFKALSVMMSMPVSVYEKNDGTVGISAMNLGMMSGMFSGAVKDVLTKGAEDFERSLEGVV